MRFFYSSFNSETYSNHVLKHKCFELHPHSLTFINRMGVRIFGIDTPEIRTKNTCEKLKGQLAKNLLDDCVFPMQLTTDSCDNRPAKNKASYLIF